MKLFQIFLFLLFSTLCCSQQRDSLQLKNGIDKPSILSTHHFGIFSARINQNFKVRPPKKSTILFSVESGNNFHPFVEAYLPEDQTTRQELKKLIWFNRNFDITQPAAYMNIVVDAVFKGFRVDVNTKINKKNELGISLRSYAVTQGNSLFTFFTADKTIEWFHSNIYGGEDPFGRKYYGLDQVNVKYTDRNGNVLKLKKGDFFIAGIELNHFYYPEISLLKKHAIHLNLGSHLGINTSKFNPSIDIGTSLNAVKKWNVKDKYELRLGVGANVLRKNSININKVIDIGNNKFLGSGEAMFEYTEFTKQKHYHSVSANFQFQTRFNNIKEADYYFLVGKWKEIHAGWQNGFEQLYKHQSAWTWLYTYGRKKWKLTIYLKEDLTLNNAPDIQTGFSLKIPLGKN